MQDLQHKLGAALADVTALEEAQAALQAQLAELQAQHADAYAAAGNEREQLQAQVVQLQGTLREQSDQVSLRRVLDACLKLC